jgi:hypothetical protein
VEIEDPPKNRSKLAILLEIDFESIMVSWLKEKIIHEVGNDEFFKKHYKQPKKKLS